MIKKRTLTVSGLVLIGLVAILLITTGSCQISYLTQAMAGHMRIMKSRRPIEKILQNDQLDAKKRDQLRLVLEIHEFAVKELDLPDNKSYTLYSEIDGDYPGWNVYCAPKFSVEPKTWCYPIAGCVVYHGYFKKEKAIEFGEKMEKENFDVYIAPFTAYSTLGWYKDPILSNHLRYDSIELAGLIIHEMAHQKFYQSGDSRYSEGFAVTVERAGIRRWLTLLGREDQLARARKGWEKEDQVVERMLRARLDLSNLYHNQKDTVMLLHKKDSILSGLEEDLKITNRKINNAWLIPISTYHSLIPHFESMLDSCGGDFTAFYKAAAHQKK